MKRLHVDFVEPPLWCLPVAARPRQVLIALGLGALFAGAAISWQWLRLAQQIDAANNAIVRVRQEMGLRTPPRAPLRLSEPEIIAINNAVGQLNTAWPALLDAFESVATADIALLQIEPDHRRRLVKGLAEAKNHQHMLAYLAAIGATRPFVNAMVSKQEVNEKDPNRPLRFMFEALLDDGAAPGAIESIPQREGQ